MTPEDKLNESTSETQLKSKTMKFSVYEGSFGVLSGTLADNYMVPFALSMQATPFQIGLLTSWGGLISPVGQIIGSRAIQKHSRRGVLLTGILGQAIIWVFFIVMGIISQKASLFYILPWFLIGCYLLYMIFGGVMTPPWFSVMGDVVPEDFRGRYFAKRNLITVAVALSGTIVLSVLLDGYGLQQKIFLGFIFIFLIGLITRLCSLFLFNKHYYPPFQFEQSNHIKFSQFIRELPRSNFGKFTLFVALMTFAQWIAGPFFMVYMLEDLQFNYTTFILVNLTTSITSLFIFPLLGKFSDKFGNVRMLKLGAFIIPFLPIMWLFFSSPLGLIFGPQLLSGIAWTAFNLAAGNFIYDNIPSQKRGEYIAFYNLILGIGVVLGALLGSALITFLTIDFMNKYHFVFLISGIARFIVIIIFLPIIKEVRVKEPKPIFNIKNTNLYRWLYDISLRESRRKKNNLDNNHKNDNTNHDKE